jgi:putative FmdB family regulatory protein
MVGGNCLMPMYEYQCKSCGHHFETLVIGARKPVCPICQGQELEKQISTFGTGGRAAYGSAAGSACAPGGG